MQWLDTSDPVVHVMTVPSSYTYEELDRQFTHVEQTYTALLRADPKLRFGLIVDLSLIAASSAANRKRIAGSIRGLSNELRVACVGHAFVARTLLIKGALTALFWIAPPPWPVMVSTSRSDAETWVRAQYSELVARSLA